MTSYLSSKREVGLLRKNLIYVEELENLTKQNHYKYLDLVKLVDKVHKATAEEKAAVKALNSYINNQEENYGSLIDRVNKIDRRHKVLEALEIEAEEIKEQGNIIAYEKQSRKKAPNILSDEQIDNINDELEKPKTQLNKTCRMANYNQEGVKQLLY